MIISVSVSRLLAIIPLLLPATQPMPSPIHQQPVAPVEVFYLPAAIKPTAVEAAQRVEKLPVPVYTPAPVTAVPAGAGDAKSYIYNHESDNDPTRWNSSGCLGLGQNCPAVKGTSPAVLLACPTMDYACEDAWFTRYMVNRYGTWDNALAFWLRTDPRPYPGHWW